MLPDRFVLQNFSKRFKSLGGTCKPKKLVRSSKRTERQQASRLFWRRPIPVAIALVKGSSGAPLIATLRYNHPT